ncbi:hypothetical protein [Pseudomonas tussilaginis]|uniref:hypothetical protein n=1 Tax=Pseudomonas sp. 5 TaxID=1619949 RepID=UPI0005EBE47C|nr:hypothetical protein [Pseudomonas sp. 5]KJK05766.1 hypothetical protein UB47_19705 [Pseudomonas sp. 5]
MTLDLISFVLGAALLVIGLIGGGIQAKEITIPAIGTSIRIGASIFGISFIILGLWLGNRFEQPDINPENTVQPSTPTSASEKILFIARDQLGANQKKEKITLFINGAQAGEFKMTVPTPQLRPQLKFPPRETTHMHSVDMLMKLIMKTKKSRDIALLARVRY